MFHVEVKKGYTCVGNCESVGLFYDSTNNMCVGCHPACATCFGQDYDECFDCNDDFLKIDNTTCDNACSPANSYLIDNGTTC